MLRVHEWSYIKDNEHYDHATHRTAVAASYGVPDKIGFGPAGARLVTRRLVDVRGRAIAAVSFPPHSADFVADPLRDD